MPPTRSSPLFPGRSMHRVRRRTSDKWTTRTFGENLGRKKERNRGQQRLHKVKLGFGENLGRRKQVPGARTITLGKMRIQRRSRSQKKENDRDKARPNQRPPPTTTPLLLRNKIQIKFIFSFHFPLHWNFWKENNTWGCETRAIPWLWIHASRVSWFSGRRTIV